VGRFRNPAVEMMTLSTRSMRSYTGTAVMAGPLLSTSRKYAVARLEVVMLVKSNDSKNYLCPRFVGRSP